MSNDATFDQGMREAQCGSRMIQAGALMTGFEAMEMVGTAHSMAAGGRLPGGGRPPMGGGPYRGVRTTNSGGQVHHMPAWGALTQWEGNPFTYRGAPSILMSVEDHMATASWGPGGAAWRAESAAMLQEGRFLDVLVRDINDVRTKFPGVYDAQIDAMLGYLWSGAW
jgi:hypothetical protein